MKNKTLAEMEFASIISEATAQTQTGAELINRYKSYVMSHDITHSLVNNFVREASNCQYDNGVVEALSMVADYINLNKTSWALASTCESLNANNSSYNYINKNFAVKQVEKLLEMNEDDVVKYIKAGALKNVMFCEEFRNIAKQVYKDNPLVEATAEYVRRTPVSLVENVGDGVCFQVKGQLFKIADDKTIQEAQAKEVSNTFRIVSQLLESQYVTIDEHAIEVKLDNATYEVSESGNVKRIGKDGEKVMTVEQLRENNRLMLMTANPRFRNQLAGILESVALLVENYDSVVNLDNVAIYETKNDTFMVIESGTNIYSTLLRSNRHPKWTINENVIEALSFIKTKTNVTLNESYDEAVAKCMEEMDEEHHAKIEAELKEEKMNSYKERIEALTEKFKNDPVKMAVLSKLAQDIANVQ
jgi:hypothetical protein